MRKHVFNAGPGALPRPVLEKLAADIPDFKGIGYSLLEASHRSGEYGEVHQHTKTRLAELLSLPEDYELLFLGGGATLQFAMVPMNFAHRGSGPRYVVSGSWAKKALADAKKVSDAQDVWDGGEAGYTTLPSPEAIVPPGDAAYLHITTNETIGGVQYKTFPATGAVPLVADMSSDILSRPLDLSQFSLIYAGAQKNLGPAGVTVVAVKKDFLERAAETVPAYLSYKTHAKADSLYNTPPVFAIWALGLVGDWVAEQGGLDAVAKANAEKAGTLYALMDASDGFYRCPVDPSVRSTMNVVFRLPSEELEKRFIAEAAEAGMVGLKGHRSVGGCRASIYNAVPEEAVAALAEFMEQFRKRA